MSRTLEHFNYLHQIPELGFEEHKTSAYIGDVLEAAGFQVQRNVGGTTGIVALLDSGKPGPVVALRADMDALGHIIDGRLEARHTCGHDGHSSVVLTAAEEILAEGLVKRGKLKILFQPAEGAGHRGDRADGSGRAGRRGDAVRLPPQAAGGVPEGQGGAGDVLLRLGDGDGRFPRQSRASPPGLTWALTRWMPRRTRCRR